jgi:HTH-type transcriptional regulator / antitoxin HipB
MEFTARTPQQLGEILRGFRRHKHLTQAQAGRAVGLLPKTVHALEQNTEHSSLASFYKLLSSLDLELLICEKAHPSAAQSADQW